MQRASPAQAKGAGADVRPEREALFLLTGAHPPWAPLYACVQATPRGRLSQAALVLLAVVLTLHCHRVLAFVESCPDKCEPMPPNSSACASVDRVSALYFGCHSRHSLFSHELDAFDEGGRPFFAATLLRADVHSQVYRYERGGGPREQEGLLFNFSHETASCVSFSGECAALCLESGSGLFPGDGRRISREGSGPRAFLWAFLGRRGAQRPVSVDFYVCTAWMYYRTRALLGLRAEEEVRRTTRNCVLVPEARRNDAPVALFTRTNESSLSALYPGVPLLTHFDPLELR